MNKNSFITYYRWLLATLFLTGCGVVNIDLGGGAQPAPAQVQPSAVVIATQPPAPTIPPGTPTQANNVSFYYDPSLAGSVQGVTVPAENIPEGMMEMSHPAYTRFNFDIYILGKRFHDPRIEVYPVTEYKQVNKTVGGVMDALQQYLTYGTTQGSIPFLPLFNAGQAVRVKVQKLSFQNGEGVRFLTLYGQWLPPLNNQELFYTFQGMTRDGKYYISAIFPITHPSLPETDSVPSGYTNESWASAAQNYVANQAATLEAQAGTSFLPSIEALDALIQSMLIQ